MTQADYERNKQLMEMQREAELIERARTQVLREMAFHYRDMEIDKRMTDGTLCPKLNSSSGASLAFRAKAMELK